MFKFFYRTVFRTSNFIFKSCFYLEQRPFFRRLRSMQETAPEMEGLALRGLSCLEKWGTWEFRLWELGLGSSSVLDEKSIWRGFTSSEHPLLSGSKEKVAFPSPGVQIKPWFMSPPHGTSWKKKKKKSQAFIKQVNFSGFFLFPFWASSF